MDYWRWEPIEVIQAIVYKARNFLPLPYFIWKSGMHALFQTAMCVVNYCYALSWKQPCNCFSLLLVIYICHIFLVVLKIRAPANMAC